MKELPISLHLLPAQVNRLFLAFSGGMDSAVLLHNLLRHRNNYHIVLWHINHGLQQESVDMEAFSRAQARHNNLDIRVDHLQLDASAGNIEATARRLRYQLFASVLTAQDALLTAHHANDQAETLLLNLMRGSGPAGLRAIARQKALGQGILIRPLLDVSRDEIQDYARVQALTWIDDPSNASQRFDRNFIRHEVMPILQQRWPTAVRQMHRACDWQNESHTLINDLAQLDYVAVKTLQPFSLYSNLSVKKLMELSDARKKNLIRYWLRQQRKTVIGHSKLEQLLMQLHQRKDASPSIAGEQYSIRVYQQQLYIVDCFQPPELHTEYEFATEQMIAIPALDFRQSRSNIFQKLKLEDQNQALSIHFRQDGLHDNGFAHRRKRLFQKHRVPPWLRDMTPLIVVDGELIGLWLF